MIANKKAMTMMLLMSSMTGMVGSSAFMLAAPIPAHAQVKSKKLDPIGMNYNKHFTTFKDAFDLQKVLSGRYTPEQISSMSIENIKVFTYSNPRERKFNTVQDALNSGITSDDIVKSGFVTDTRYRTGIERTVENGGIVYSIKGNFSNTSTPETIYLQPYIYENVSLDKEYVVKGGVVGTKKYTVEDLTNGKFNSEDWEILRYNGKEQAPGTTSQEITLASGQVVTWDMVLKPRVNLTELWETDQARVKNILSTAGASTTEFKNDTDKSASGRDKYPTYPNKPGEFIYVGRANDATFNDDVNHDDDNFRSVASKIMDIVEDPIVSVKGVLSDDPAPTTTSTIDPNTPVSLTIHKHLGDPTGQPANGERQEVNRSGLAGVVFTVQKINGLDPKNLDDWKKYSRIDPKDINSSLDSLGDGYSLGNDKEYVTDKNGIAKTSGLEQGFYYVSENFDDNNPNRTMAPPFLVSLPMTNSTGNTWNYNVHVHPKNQQLNVTKEVKDQGVALNEGDITYTVRGDVPSPQTVGGSFNQYIINDDYDENSVSPELDTVKVSFVKPGNGNDEYSNIEELIRDSDYVIDNDFEGVLSVKLNSSGLKKLYDVRSADGNSNVKVQLQFQSKLTGISYGSWPYLEVINKATITPPHHPNVVSSTIPTNEVATRLVNYEIYKVDGDSREVLPGAEFELHRCEHREVPVGFAPGESVLAQEGNTLPSNLESINQMNQDGTKSDVIKNSKMRVNGKDKWVTDDEGKINIDGVQVNNFWDGEEQDTDWVYCLVEVKAPKGYELNPKPIKLFSDGDTTVDNGYSPYATEAIVNNYPGNGGFQLPVTGAQGIMWLALGALTIAGVTYLVMGRRNRD